MTIAEMHVFFRQYAQQMGMQNVRGILPEQIDILLNTSISDTINQLIKEHIGATTNQTLANNSKLGEVNAFKTLYKVKVTNMGGIIDEYGSVVDTFSFNPKDRNKGLMRYDSTNHSKDFIIPDCLFLVDFSLNYRQAVTGIEETSNRTELPQYDPDGIETMQVPVRLIDESKLAHTVNDFILKNRFQSPILVMYNNGSLEVYIDKFTKRTVNNKDYYTLANNFIPYEFKVSYIAHPAKVVYSTNVADSIDCDLPEYMHVDIIKHAVDLYNVSIKGAPQIQQDRDQTSGDTRNNYRNESY